MTDHIITTDSITTNTGADLQGDPNAFAYVAQGVTFGVYGQGAAIAHAIVGDGVRQQVRLAGDVFSLNGAAVVLEGGLAGSTVTVTETGSITSQFRINSLNATDMAAIHLNTGGAVHNAGEISGRIGLQAYGPVQVANAGTLTGLYSEAIRLMPNADGADEYLISEDFRLTNTGTIIGGMVDVNNDGNLRQIAIREMTQHISGANSYAPRASRRTAARTMWAAISPRWCATAARLSGISNWETSPIRWTMPE